MINARLCEFLFLGWILLASLHLYYVEILVHPKSLKPVLPYESTIATYMRYIRVVLSKFVCAIYNFQNEFPFCVLAPLMKRQGVANIFHARCVILKMSVYSPVIA